ncbi:MAG: alpha/beta hydrolase [Desulfobacterales bacterium]|nr:alpha/beta hydrolase [Desulfobacterales bacterium]
MKQPEKQHLVLIPGLLCDDTLWENQTRHLADLADIAIPALTRQTYIAAMADAVLATATGRFALAGLSMGGYVCFEIMRRAPQRVTRLALLDTSARPDTEAQKRSRRRLIELARSGRFDEVVEILLPILVHANRLEDRRLCEKIGSMNRRVGAEAFVRQQHAIMARPDSRVELPRISCPTLVLCGRQDAMNPIGIHEEISYAIPGARLAVIEACGHMSSMERPHAVTALLRDWLMYR